MSDLKFSVSMCVYGGDNARFFKEALESVFNQTRMPDEVVLVVDGPVGQDIDDVIFEYESCFGMKVYRLAENMGHGNARRLGFSKCSYDYVAICDADDVNDLTRFEKQLEEFEKNPALSAISSSCYHFVDDVSNPINEEKLPLFDADIKRFLKTRCPLCQPSVMLKKEEVEKAGGYLDWYHCEDYYLWVRMHMNGAVFANLEEPLVNMRMSQSQMKRRGGLKYFLSMKKLYGFMLKNNVIGIGTYLFNLTSRFIVQILLPANVRAYIRKKIQ